MIRHNFFELNIPKELISIGRTLESLGGTYFDIPMMIPCDSLTIHYLNSNRTTIGMFSYDVLTKNSWIILEEEMYRFGVFFWGISNHAFDSPKILWVMSKQQQKREIVKVFQAKQLLYSVYEEKGYATFRGYV